MSPRKFLIGVSVVVGHAALFTGVFVSGVWDLDRVQHKYRAVASIGVQGPPPSPGGSVDLPAVELKPKQATRVVREVRQPRRPQESRLAIEQPGSPGDGTPGSGGGAGDGDPDHAGTCTDPAGCEPGEPVAELPKLPELPAPVVEEEPKVLVPEQLKALRLSGDTAIRPGPTVQRQMVRDDRMKTSAVLLVCVTEHGHVGSVAVRKSTSYPDYDDALVRGVRGWRYRPYMDGDKARPVCSTVTFQYEMR